MNPNFCYTAFILLASITLVSGAESSPVPKRFSAYIGGFMGTSYQLELRDGALTHTTFGGGYKNPRRTALTPTAAQWSEFRLALDRLKVWQWRADYPSNRTVDGTQWSLDVAFGDRAIKTHGDNNYPGETGKPNGKPEPTKTFTLYLEAVEKLTGGKTFK